MHRARVMSALKGIKKFPPPIETGTRFATSLIYHLFLPFGDVKLGLVGRQKNDIGHYCN